MALTYMTNPMVFKVNHMVQGQPWTQPNPFYYCTVNHGYENDVLMHMDLKSVFIRSDVY